MHSKFDTEQPYVSDDSDFSTLGDAIFASLALWLGDDSGSSQSGGGSTSGQNEPNSTVAVTSGGIVINLLFDAAAMAAPASFRAAIQQAAALLGAAIFDPITVNLKVHYTGTGGGAFAGPDAGVYENYSTIRADLINNATLGDTTFNALPSGSSIQGQSTVAVWNAQ